MVPQYTVVTDWDTPDQLFMVVLMDMLHTEEFIMVKHDIDQFYKKIILCLLLLSHLSTLFFLQTFLFQVKQIKFFLY